MSAPSASSPTLPRSEIRVALVEDGALADLLQVEIESSKTMVRIASYLFTLDVRAAPNNPVRRIVRALSAAAQRDVVCRVLLGDPGDARLAALNSITSAFLRQRGVDVRIVETPPLHAKFAVVDELFSTVGSHNLTPRALTGASELTAVMWGNEAAARFSAAFDQLWEKVPGVEEVG